MQIKFTKKWLKYSYDVGGSGSVWRDPANNYQFKGINRNARESCKICSKLITKIHPSKDH